MRIAVVANCQGEGIAAALKALNPNLETSFVFITDIQNGKVNIDDVLAGNDIVLAQKNAVPMSSNDQYGKVLYFPNIVFDGYHPDIIFIRGIKKGGESIETVTSDMVIYHSAIAFYGYFYGLSVDDTVNYFNHYVVSKLGYAKRWDLSRDALLEEGEAVGMPLAADIQRWASQGCFMYSNNHPRLRVLADIARRCLERLNIEILHENIEDYVSDALKAMPIWPVYPQIAAARGIKGDFTFKRHDPHGILSLRQFVEQSFAIYDEYERDSLQSLTITPQEMADLIYGHADTKPVGNPYKGADRRQFWKNSVAGVQKENLDPVFATQFGIGLTDKVATAGSCFAQHIARTLSRSGFNYYVAELPPSEMDADSAQANNYGVFSARYGNIYTVRQLVQLLDRAYGRFSPDERYWTTNAGRYVDPFRPQIEQNGFESVSALESSRQDHLAAVRTMVESMDVFVFTLGLTEGWRSKIDGAVFPLAPGVAGGGMDFDRYEFVNFSADEVSIDLLKAIDLIRAVNPTCRVILTVSPVPLIATYEHQHALVATTYSKSVLRVAAAQAANTLRDVEYFGSYEIITGSYNRGSYFLDDLRSVTDEGVAHVMRIFMENYTGRLKTQVAGVVPTDGQHSKSKSLFDIVCDEEAIANF